MDSPLKMTVNPVTNMIYVIGDKGKSVYKVDSYTNTIVSNLTLNGEASDIAVNPVTDIVYVTNTISNSVDEINMTKPALLADIPVGNSPSSIDVNPNTNMIYATNANSGTVSIINGATSNTTAGIAFKVDPIGRGYIECNRNKVTSNYIRFDMGTRLTCEARPYIDSAFSWLDLNKAISSLFKPYSKSEFDSWSGTEFVGSENPSVYCFALRNVH